MRDMTVPIGMSSISAISAYENSSTSRNQTACRKPGGRASSASCSAGRGVAGGGVAVDDGASAIAGPVLRSVVKDSEEPRPQIRTRLELVGRAKGLQI